MDPGKLIERILKRPRIAYVMEVLDTYGRGPGGLLANGLAFAALFATVPTALVVLGVAGWLVGDPKVQVRLAEAISELFPPLADVVEEALLALSSGAAITSVLGLIGLIWTVSQLYVTLDVAFARIFSDGPERDVFRRTARGFIWVAGLIGVIVALVVGGSLAVAAEALLPDSSPFPSRITTILGSLPTLMLLAFVGVLGIYRTLPPARPRWRSIALPAIVAGPVIILLTQVFMALAPRLVGAAAVAGSLATAFIALAWLSFSFQILLYGASWAKVREDRAGGPSALAGPAPPAEPGGGGQ